VTASIELKVFHPIAHVWITRCGVASKQIMVHSKTDAMKLENKIQNCLITVMPALKAECIKNAAKSLGAILGRNLNRDIEDDYQSLSEQIGDLTERQTEALLLIDTLIKDKATKDVWTSQVKSAGSKKLDDIIETLKAKSNGKAKV
jgi:hypothetical protein